MSTTPTRALALSSSRTPRQQVMMAGTQGRNRLDVEAIVSNGRHSGRKVQTPNNNGGGGGGELSVMSPNGALSPAASVYSANGGTNGHHQVAVAGMSSARRAPVDVTGSGGVARGTKKVHDTNNRAAQASNGSGALPDRVDKRMLKKLTGRESSITNLGAVVEPPVTHKGKKCGAPDAVPNAARGTATTTPMVNNIFKNEASPVRRSAEINQHKAEFQKMVSPKRRNFTFSPSEKIDKRDPETRLMDSGSVPRKTKRTNYTARTYQSPQAATTPPWVHHDE